MSKNLSHRTVALAVSHVFNQEKFSQLSDENLLRHLQAFEKENYSKVIIIPTGMLNEHCRKPGLSDIDKKLDAFEFTYDFLRSKIPQFLSLKIPFEILTFDQVKYQGLHESLHTLFTVNSDNLHKKIEGDLLLWKKKITAQIKSPEGLIVKNEFIRALHDIKKHYNENVKFHKEIYAAAKRTHQTYNVSLDAAVNYILDESAFLLNLTRINEEKLLENNKKYIDSMAYSGIYFPSFSKKVLRNVCRDANRFDFIELTEHGTFKNSLGNEATLDTLSPPIDAASHFSEAEAA